MSVPLYLDKDGKEHKSNLTPSQSLNLQANIDFATQQNKEHLQRTPVFQHTHSSRALSLEELIFALSQKPDHKTPGPTEVVYEHFKHAGEKVHQIILLLFNLFFLTGITPATIQRNYIILLHKKGSIRNIMNYRPITLACTLLKLYETLLHNRTKSILLDKGVPNFLQHAGVPHKGSIEAITLLIETILANPNHKFILHKLDLSKAFDRTDRNILFHKLYMLGIRGRLWRALFSTYSHSSSQISIGAHLSEPFTLPNGIKQGSVLSTLFFIVSLHDLLVDLQHTNIGPQLNNTPRPATGFVDDHTLITTNVQDFQTILNITLTHLAEHGHVINHSKGETSHHRLSKKEIASLDKDHKPAKGNTLEMLGITISTPFTDAGWKHHITVRSKKMLGVFHELKNAGLKTEPSFIKPNLKIFHTMLLPILTHGLQLVNPTNTITKLINKKQVQVLKIILNLPKHAPTMWTLWEAGALHALPLIQLHTIRPWRKYALQFNPAEPTNHQPSKRILNPNQPTKPTSKPPLPSYEKKVSGALESWGITRDTMDAWTTTTPLPSIRKWKRFCIESSITQNHKIFRTWADAQAFPYALIKTHLHQQTPVTNTPAYLSSNTNSLRHFIMARANSLLPPTYHNQQLSNQCHPCIILGFPPHTQDLITCLLQCTSLNTNRHQLMNALTASQDHATLSLLTNLAQLTGEQQKRTLTAHLLSTAINNPNVHKHTTIMLAQLHARNFKNTNNN